MKRKRPFRKKILWLALLVIAAVIAVVAFNAYRNKEVMLEAEPVFREYDFRAEVSRAKNELDASKMAEIITGIAAQDNVMALTFDGANEIDVLNKVIGITQEYGVQGMFFLPGVEIAEYGRFAKDIWLSGSEVGSYTLYGNKHMDTLPVDSMIEDFVYASGLMETAVGVKPIYLKCNNSKYTDQLRMAAAASGFEYVVESTHILSYQSFSSLEMTRDYIRKLPNGSILSIKMAGVLDEEEYIVPEKEQGFREAGVATETVEKETASEEERLLQVVEWVCQSIQELNRPIVSVSELPSLPVARQTVVAGVSEPLPVLLETSVYMPKPSFTPAPAGPTPEQLEQERLRNLAQELRSANKGQLAEPINMVYTTEQALSYTFYGIAGEAALRDVLNRMNTFDISGTFFVSMEDIELYSDRIRSIQASGHEIGIALLPRDSATYEQAAQTLLSTAEMLQKNFGIATKLVMMPFGEATPDIKEAVSANGNTLIYYSFAAVRSADEFETSAETVLSGLFSSTVDSLKRGEIAYFRLDFYKSSDTLVGEVMQQIKEKYVDVVRYPLDREGVSAYAIRGVGSLLANSGSLYTYPLPANATDPERRNAITPGHLGGLSNDEVFETIRQRYIGNPDVISSNNLPGFTDEQIASLDKTGKIDTNGQNILFLTFDDWANDLTVNHLLYVLRKHGVKASFFIRANYVPSNPNLLRAIAMEGHDINSHTLNHMPLADPSPENDVYISITEDEVEQLQFELTESHRIMMDIAGDVLNEKGLPTVGRYFRAPTLAQSYLGLRTVFDCGYTYSISGDFSAGDYGANSAAELKDILVNGIDLRYADENRQLGAGSIAVLHVSPTAAFTAEAVDMFLTENAQKPPAERYYFARLSDYLEN